MKRFLSLFAVLLCCALFLNAKSNSSKAAEPLSGERKVLTVEGIEYPFRRCPPGEFVMGAPESEFPNRSSSFPYDEIPHKVKLTRGFWLLETEVTQEMWKTVMGSNLSYFNDDRNPVEKVSWADCQEFCRKLSQKLGQKVQLPTEAQWEYACRAGTTGKHAGTLDEMAWNDDNSNSMTHEVGSKRPNAWGLYDMNGNVHEWCSDWYDKEYYATSPANDPENTTVSSYRVRRGGGWYCNADGCRSALRHYDEPEYRSNNLGLRVLLVPNQND